MRASIHGALAVTLALTAGGAAAQAIHTVTVNRDGTYSPANLVIDAGDTVVWDFAFGGHAIVELAGAPGAPPSCKNVAGWDPNALNAFAGPMPKVASGIMALAPNDESSLAAVAWADASDECRNARNPIGHDGDVRCPDDSLPPHHVLDEVLTNPGVAGVFLRYNWNEIEPEPGQFDFAALDEEIDRAVAAGKLYSLGIRAGKHGTPDWLGSALHLPLMQLMDTGSNPGEGACGASMFLADPTDTAYAQRYGQMLRGIADHLKENASRWRALAYVKVSGANMFSHENRLPKRCEPGCPICNTEVWAAAGYTPEGLYAFYGDQLEAIAAHFPGKSTGYMLIQAGFPRVLDADHYEGCLAPGCEAGIPGGTEQTTEILARGAAAQGAAFVVAHNGLDPIREGECPTEDMHPPDPDASNPPQLSEYRALPSACPNPWVLYHGATGQFTGWQTINLGDLNTLEGLDATLSNAERNSDGIYVELYEQLIWLAGRTGGVLDPAAATPRTLAQWAEVFHARRRNPGALGLPSLPDPYPSEHFHLFRNGGSDRLTYWYTDPSRCDASSIATIGTITVNP